MAFLPVSQENGNFNLVFEHFVMGGLNRLGSQAPAT